MYAYEPESWDSLIPRMMMMKEDKHFDGLELCGGFGFLCHGYGSAYTSGQTAGLLTFKDMMDKGEI